ncbi:MAG: DUF2380 domain-containing protein [Candidatus Marinimicrobia bacterium]|nr:DUF2380 domain-containing protein [Candidatus Neomarinimicrobiota bacterium]
MSKAPLFLTISCEVLLLLLMPASAAPLPAPESVGAYSNDPQHRETKALVVLDFKGRGISRIEARVISDRLRYLFLKSGTVRVFDRGMMDEILAEEDIQWTGCDSNECAVEVGRRLGAQLILTGSAGKVGDIWYIEGKVIDVKTERVTKPIRYEFRGDIDLYFSEALPFLVQRVSEVSILDLAADAP